MPLLIVLAILFYSSPAISAETLHWQTPTRLVQEFDFESPLGIKLGETKCSELAHRLGTTWRSLGEPVGITISQGGLLHVTLSVKGCDKPGKSITEAWVGFQYTLHDELERSNQRELIDIYKGLAHRITKIGETDKTADFGDEITSFHTPEVTGFFRMTYGEVLVIIRETSGRSLRKTRIEEAKVKPLGVAIGISNCRDAAVIFGAEPQKPVRRAHDPTIKWVQVTLRKNAERHYPGATLIEANCYSGPNDVVDDMTILVRDAEDNQVANAVYRVLSSKYRRTAGGSVSSKGSSYARFSAPGVEIELEVPGDGSDFSVSYTESGLFKSVEDDKKRKKESL